MLFLMLLLSKIPTKCSYRKKWSSSKCYYWNAKDSNDVL